MLARAANQRPTQPNATPKIMNKAATDDTKKWKTSKEKTVIKGGTAAKRIREDRTRPVARCVSLVTVPMEIAMRSRVVAAAIPKVKFSPSTIRKRRPRSEEHTS